MNSKTSIVQTKTQIFSDISSYRRYAEIKAKIKDLEDEASLIAPTLISELENTTKGCFRTLWGHFSLRKNKTIKYPAAVEKRIGMLKNEIRDEQERSLATGKCKVVESNSLVLSQFR
jgi:hypothetical protein